MRLVIEVTAEKTCDLYAMDNTHYLNEHPDGMLDYVFVEFVCYCPYITDNQNLLALDASKKVTAFTTEASLDRRYVYKMQRDGTYRYYKYGLYTLDHSTIFYNDVYHIKNKIFFHEGKVYYGLQDIGTPTITKIDADEIINWYTLREYFPQSIDFYFDKEIFSICNLNKCLVILEKKAIFDGLKNCNFGDCAKDKALKLQRDFLFISVFVLEHLLAIENYEEAQRILESLASCRSLCDNEIMFSNNKCCE